MFDSGAAANCCRPDFAPEFALLQLDKAPPLKSISGQTLNIYGRKLVACEMGGERLWLNFYVCDAPCSVISALSTEDSRLEGLSGEGMPVVRYGLLLFKCPKLVGLDPAEFLHFSSCFHAQFAARPPPELLGAPTFKPVHYHADFGVLDSANH